MSSVGSALGASNPQSLVYRNEPPLFAIALIISLLAWMLLLVGTLGVSINEKGVNKQVVWKCVPGEVEPKYLPARCRQP